MHIFIDESGVFVPPKSGANKVSCVVALVIPSSQIDRLRRRFERLTRGWGQAGKEIKGSRLSETEVAAVIQLLREYEVIMEGQDYSHFSRFYVSNEDFPDFLQDLSQRSGCPGAGGIDLKRVLTESLRFADSSTDPGLRMADIVASAFTRALNGTLRREGWRRLGELMVRKPLMVMLRVNKDEPTVASVHPPYAAKFREIEAAGRPMLTPRNERRANRTI